LKRFGWKNMMAVPKLQKINGHIGLGEASQNAKAATPRQLSWARSPGRSRDSPGEEVHRELQKFARACLGCAVTFGAATQMYEFLDPPVQVVAPARARSAFAPDSFDGRGNYTLGLKEQLGVP